MLSHPEWSLLMTFRSVIFNRTVSIFFFSSQSLFRRSEINYESPINLPTAIKVTECVCALVCSSNHENCEINHFQLDVHRVRELHFFNHKYKYYYLFFLFNQLMSWNADKEHIG